MENTLKKVTKQLRPRKIKIKKKRIRINKKLTPKNTPKNQSVTSRVKESYKKIKIYKPKGYFKKARTETEEEKERRLAKTFLSKKIKQMEQYRQTPKVKKHIKELKMNRESIGKTYKRVRQYQHSLKHRKRNEIRNITETIEQATSTELAKQVRRVLDQYNYEELQRILDADDNLLRDISKYYPEEEAELDIRARRELRSQYIEKIKIFIEKYGNKEEAIEDL
jgi:hypothetical protein